MGCDIHLFVEVNQNNMWESVDEWEDEDGYTSVVYDKRYYSSRNYDLFALLANVRNYHGTTPIKNPIGLPSDVSDVVKQHSEDYGVDGHSHSYYTLTELLEIDWDGAIKEAGYIEDERWSKFYASLQTDNPDYKLRYPYSQGIGSSLHATHTWHEWEIPLKISVSDFYNLTLPKLVKLGEPNNVRIVFFFDN